MKVRTAEAECILHRLSLPGLLLFAHQLRFAGAELEVSPHAVFTKHAVLERDTRSFSVHNQQLLFLRGRVRGTCCFLRHVAHTTVHICCR